MKTIDEILDHWCLDDGDLTREGAQEAMKEYAQQFIELADTQINEESYGNKDYHYILIKIKEQIK